MKMLAGYAKNAIKNLTQPKMRFGLTRSIIGPRFGVLGVTVIVLVIFPLLAPRSFAASIGPNSPTVASGTSWTGAANVYSADSTDASYSLSAGATSSALNVTGFGFNISSNATIDGVQVGVIRYAPSVNRSAVTDGSIYLLKGGVTTGMSQATATTWPTTNGAATYGGSAALWGASLTPSDVNASSFGVAITATNTKTGGNGGSNTAYIDYVSVTVSYTLNNTFTQASYRLYGNQDASSAGTGNFKLASSPAVGGGPYGIITADFNGDGWADVATADHYDNAVTILIGDDTGNFTLASSPRVGNGPGDLTKGDFNGDGNLDLATVDSSDNAVTLLLGDGRGVFTTAAGPATGPNPQHIVTADFNGDGKADLATANYGDNTASILLGDGAGNFTLTSSPAVGSGPGGITTADFNGDNKADLAVSNYGGTTVTILVGDGSGNFTLASSPTVGSAPSGIVTADFNGDGKADLATVNSGGSSASVLLGNGSASFTLASSPTVGSSPKGIVTADFNGDGKLDLGVANSGSRTASALLGNGTGGFTLASSSATGNSPSSLVSADFNNDGKPDMAVANNAVSGTVTTLLGVSTINTGAALAAQNTAATVPGDGQPFRLRMDIGIGVADLPASGQSFKLQYAPMSGSCSATSGYGDVTDTSTIKYYDNTIAASGTALGLSVNDPADGTNTTANGGVIPQTYQEKGTTTFTNPTAIPAGQDGMWDFALTTNGAVSSQHYCLRMVGSSGTPLTTYSAIPEIIAPPSTLSQSSYRFFEDSSTTVPTTRAWGGTGSDTGTSIVATADGGYAISGGTSGVAFLAKYDKKDNLTWSHAISGAGGSSLIATDDGGYAISSSTSSYGSGGSDMVLTKYDSSGNLSWSRTWGGAGGDESYALAQTTDGGYALAGDSLGSDGSVDVAVVKYDSSGNLQWAHTWGVGGSGFDYALAIVATSDGGIALTGPTAVTGNNDMFLLKYDSSGGLTWARTWGGALPDKGNSLVQNSDGGYTVTGETYNYGAGNTDMFLATYNSSGTLQWSRTWGGTGSEYGSSIVSTTDGGYAVTGRTDSFGAGSYDMFLAKYTSTGTLQWSYTWGATGGDYGTAVVQVADGGYAVTGSTDSYGAGGMDVLLAKYESDGSMLNCSAPMCQSPAATTTSPTVSTTSPAANTASPTLTSTSPSPSTTPLLLTTTSIVAGDVVAAGTPLTAQNTSANVAVQTPFRLRSRIAVDDGNLQQNGQNLKLQYKEKTAQVCDQNAVDYIDMTVSSGASTSNYAGSASQTSGGASWSSLTNAIGTANSTQASVNLTANPSSSNYLVLSGYGLSVPSNATVTGITATVAGSVDDNVDITDIYITKDGTTNNLLIGNFSSSRFQTGSPVTYGSSTNTSSGWSPADVNNSTFGLRLGVNLAGGTSGGAGIDSVQITVHYTVVGGGGSGPITYYDNTSLADGASIAASPDDPTNGTRPAITQTYREVDPFTNSIAPIPAGSDGLWDFALTSAAAADGKTYCLRVVKSDGSLLDSYTQISEVTIGTPPPAGPTLEQQLRGGQGVVNGVKTPFMF